MKALNIGKVKYVTLREMFEHVTASFYDVCRDAYDDDINCMEINMLTDIQESIIKRDRAGIGQSLRDGFTSMMVPNFSENLNELRVLDDDTKEVIMVFVGDELNW